MSKWIPNRKILASGVGAIVAYLAVVATRTWLGVDVTMEIAMALVGIIGTALGYIVPEDAERILDQADDILAEYFAEDEDA